MKNLNLSVIVLLTAFVLMCGCDRANTPDKTTGNKLKTISKSDSLRAGISSLTAPQSDEIQNSKTELEQRLEKIVSLIEEKEQNLKDRENTAVKMEMRLAARADELEQKEDWLTVQQYIAWIVFVIGIISMIVAIVIFRLNARSTPKNIDKLELQRKKFVEKMEAEAREWDEKINALTKKANDAKDELKQDYQKQVDALQKKKSEALKALENLKLSGADAWDELETGVEKSWIEMKKAITRANSRIK
ncbi:hypothetical protein JW960_11540 [candidate division KSB1 bacterium]|nr:hypothetical protein [candidate division KSB1 bacterium]